jgi:hypothetical protein
MNCNISSTRTRNGGAKHEMLENFALLIQRRIPDEVVKLDSVLASSSLKPNRLFIRFKGFSFRRGFLNSGVNGLMAFFPIVLDGM